MTSMTFTSLQQDMRRYLEAGFTETSDPFVYEQIPRLINLAEQRIAREIKVQQFIRPVTFVTTPSIDAYQKPDRWRDTISMMINGDNINARSYEYVRKAYPQSVTGGYGTGSTGIPTGATIPGIASDGVNIVALYSLSSDHGVLVSS